MTRVIEGVDFAVDEHIWGHRLYDEQLEDRLTSREQGLELAKAWGV